MGKAANDDVPVVWPIEAALKLVRAMRFIQKAENILVSGKFRNGAINLLEVAEKDLRAARRLIERNGP